MIINPGENFSADKDRIDIGVLVHLQGHGVKNFSSRS